MIQPLSDWLLVKLDPLPEKRGNLFILEDSTVNTLRTATVLRTGPGKPLPGTNGKAPMEVAPGDKVAFFRWHLEHKTGQQVTAFLEGHDEDVGLIRLPDVLFAFSAEEKVVLS